MIQAFSFKVISQIAQSVIEVLLCIITYSFGSRIWIEDILFKAKTLAFKLIFGLGTSGKVADIMFGWKR